MAPKGPHARQVFPASAKQLGGNTRAEVSRHQVLSRKCLGYAQKSGGELTHHSLRKDHVRTLDPGLRLCTFAEFELLAKE
jgi:hypothetical protein